MKCSGVQYRVDTGVVNMPSHTSLSSRLGEPIGNRC